MTTSEKYQAAKDAYGLTDYQVAKESGVPVSTLYDWVGRMAETPNAGMSIGNMARVAQALGITLDELVGDMN